MAKPLANGFPMGAVMVSQAIANEIKVGDHGISIWYDYNSGTTFGGNPLASRLAHNVFQRISSPEMLAQIVSTSSLFQSRLANMAEKFPQIVDSIRGKGLLLGIQLKSVGNKSLGDLANLAVTKARRRGLLIITAGEGTIRLVPPLNIPEKVALDGLDILESALEDVSRDI